MIDPVGRLHNPASAEGIVSGGTRSQPARSQAFAAELSDKLASSAKSEAKTAGLPATLPAGQEIATWRDPVRTGTTTSSTTTSSSTSTPSGLNGLVITYPSTTSGSTSGSSSATETTTPETMSFDQTYWASQPPAVQQLQNIQDPTQRAEVATQLAKEGYSIDVPIMVWGWDAATTTAARESMGYTWVPSAEQQPVEVAPGLTYASASYNPAQPPSGSITV
jgi:hypothetical protein